nr:MAG TPA: hypothetical protein [Caudoviricetes sp.]
MKYTVLPDDRQVRKGKIIYTPPENRGMRSTSGITQVRRYLSSLVEIINVETY